MARWPRWGDLRGIGPGDRPEWIPARELGITAAILSAWRGDFLAGGQAMPKSRPTDDRDDEIARLRAKVGEPTKDNELLLRRCRADRPFVPRRWKM